jgi:AmpE protein
MLIALIVERLAVRSSKWQLVSYLRPYLNYAGKAPFSALTQQQGALLLWCALPVLLLTLVLWLIDFWLVTLVVNTLVLLLCMGCWHYRQLYKQYLNAAARDDQHAAFLTMQQLNTDAGIRQDELSHGQRLVWLNFKYYAAVLFWFAVLGAFGALLYAMLRLLAEPATYIRSETAKPDDAATASDSFTTSEAEAGATAAEPTPAASADVITPDAAHQQQTQQSADDLKALAERTEQLSRSLVLQQRLMNVASDLSHWADWLPARLFGLGFALVGHFSRASAILLSYLGDTSTPACQVLTDIAKAAEPLPDEMQNCSTESCSLVQLAKRNILFFLALVAILTLSGALS